MFHEIFAHTYIKEVFAVYLNSNVTDHLAFSDSPEQGGPGLQAASQKQLGGPSGRSSTLKELFRDLASRAGLGHRTGMVQKEGCGAEVGLRPIFGPSWPLDDE